MKTLFFTSNTKHYHKDNGKKIANELDNQNKIVDQLKCSIINFDSILYIAANPEDFEKVDSYASLIFEGLKLSGIGFKNYFILDNRTYMKAAEYVQSANVIFLSGGDTYIENEFFEEINLRELLKKFEGVIIGQSAGSINMAENVYNSPEEGDVSEPIYFKGLGLSKINIEPHFNFDTDDFDDMKMYQRNHLLEESKTRQIYAICDGTHILETDDFIIAYGKTYLIENGIITSICDDKKSYMINQ